MVHCILLFTLSIVFPPYMRTDLPFLDPNQPPESKRACWSFCDDFTWMPAVETCHSALLCMLYHWGCKQSFCTLQRSWDGMGWDVSKLPNSAGVGNICAQYPFSAGSPNETFQSKTLAACLVSQGPVGFSATGTCWQTRWVIYYYKDQCAEKYSRYSHVLLLNPVYPRC